MRNSPEYEEFSSPHLGTHNRGVKTADYYVLRNTNMSAILTELAFIDNYSDSQILANPSYRQEAARAILHGLQTHYGETPHDPMVPIDIILDTDRSGSMSGQKIIDAKNAATLFVDLLESQDQVGLVSFSSSATLDSHLTSDFEHAKSVIAGYSAGGSTNMGDALSKSIQELKTNGRDDMIWSIIYFTDGQTNTGLTKTEILDTLVPEAVDSGIIIYTLGYGSNVDEDFLRQVAEATGGKYVLAQ